MYMYYVDISSAEMGTVLNNTTIDKRDVKERFFVLVLYR